MRIVLATLLVLALSLPAVALADSGAGSTGGGSQTTRSQESKKQKKHKTHKRKRKHGQGGSRRAGTLELKGPLTSLSPATVGTTACVVPEGMTITGIVVGDVVEMKCVLVDGVWTLRRLTLEDEGTGKLEVKGAVQSLSPLTVNGVACVVPAGTSLGNLAVGDVVEMTCRQVGGVWTLVRVEQRGGDGDHAGATDDDDDRQDDHHGGDHSGGGDDD